jgi:hypothetical protein
VTYDTGSGIDASVDLVLDEVISPVRLVTIRAVTALQGRCQRIVGGVTLQT